jgi:hypothetical protein
MDHMLATLLMLLEHDPLQGYERSAHIMLANHFVPILGLASTIMKVLFDDIFSSYFSFHSNFMHCFDLKRSFLIFHFFLSIFVEAYTMTGIDV